MDKQQFNSLDVTDQIQYINESLHNTSLTKLCDAIGINRATVSKRFKSKGYKYNKYFNQFIEATESNEKALEPTVETTDTSIALDNYESLEKRIKALEDKYIKLEQQINNNSATSIQQLDNNNNIRFYKDETVVRAYRVDVGIQQRFKAFCEAHSQYKISDIISTALEDFLDKFE